MIELDATPLRIGLRTEARIDDLDGVPSSWFGKEGLGRRVGIDIAVGFKTLLNTEGITEGALATT
jgi:hypothetical protein